MNQRRLGWCLPLVIGVLMVLSSTSANAQNVTTSVVVNCTSSGQVCTPAFSTIFTSSQASPLTIQFTASAGHCSNIQVAVSVDGNLVSTSGFLTPGQSTGSITTGTLAAGPHTVALQATGQVGGCNTGSLAAWGGSLNISAPTVPSIPAPATWVLMISGLALVGLYARKLRLATSR